MLTVYGTEGRTRREFLRIGTSSVGGLTLSGLLAAQAAAGIRGAHLHDRSVVVLNMQGGPTQYETFDPKMTAPAEIRSITGELQTSLAGETFGGTFPMLAGLADLAVVSTRDLQPRNGGHARNGWG